MLKTNLNDNANVTSNSAFLKELRNKLPEFFTADKGDEDGTVISQGKFDFEKFKSMLEENSIQTELTSGYQLNFIGKNYAKKQTGEAPTTVVLPDKEHNKQPENKNSQNLFFTGNNLEVLRHLQASYENSIDIIYIDPPYNTGSDGFVYDDKFEYSDDKLQDLFGMNDEELERFKSIYKKATHSAWLAFMYPRLWLAKRLLKETGVIFVSIDDNEQANLKLLMDEIFGEGNFVSTLAVENNPKGRKNSKYISVNHETLHIYSKNSEKTTPFENIVKKDNLLEDEVGFYTHGKRVLVGESTNNKANGGEKDYSVYFNGHDIVLKTELLSEKDTELENKGYKVYRSIKDNILLENTYSKSKFLELYQNKSLLFKENSIYEKDRNVYKQQKSFIKSTEEWDLKTETAGFSYNDFNLKKLFTMPKNPQFIKMLIKMIGNSQATILDFFAGSATTADAVMQLNAEDGGTRQYIMVQLPEKTYDQNSDGKKVARKGSETAFTAGYQSIDEISRERIKRASQKIQEEKGENLPETFDGGFKHYRVLKPKQATLDDLDAFDIETGEFIDSKGNHLLLNESGFDDMIKPFSSQELGFDEGASGEDTILATWLLADGYDILTFVETLDLAGYQASYVNDERVYLIAKGWSFEQTKALVNLIGKNEKVIQTIVLYGYSFDMESMRELELVLAQLDTKVNLIKRY
ncbi:site-specific DNA-methyltransferase [Streptococcus sp. sy018]|uniref:site-specific DNA-methyltransferase n=1 Tax=Streptococcus sp. sy018 TaxID=2600147 RepID=UPI0011B56EC8|nr:site-specific DNA-methyltransferase [Streptococcus sp. sy018]TWS95310.1 site-specific DNA-methyltransferase [Streptococcus sp. sy018]